ncbi:MAG: MFS transporter, partial [Robiginitomaculum sp.]|nr:MFS transporter [Robiginitomaculum sp.]
GSPPSHSIISDLYPKEERGGALSIYALGIPIGLGFAYFITGIALGNPGSGFDWRKLLIWLGIAGVGLAVIVRIVIREPERGVQEASGTGEKPPSPPFSEALSILLSIPSWWAMCLGIAFASFAGYAFSTWQIDYLLPFDGSSEKPVGFKNMMFTLGFINMFAYGFGTWLGGYLADRFAKRNNNVRAYALIPAITVMCALPLAVLSFWVPTVWAHMAVITVFVVFLGMYLGPSFAIAQTLAPINMRAMSTALFFLILNIIALGGGPTIVGILVDVFEPAHGKVHAIRISMTWVSLSFVVSAISFMIAAKNLPKDWAAAEKRNEAVASD